MGDVFIRGIELPAKVKGVTVVDDDGDYNVYINTSLCEGVQQEALIHEMSHIVSEHFYGFDSVERNEEEACTHHNMDKVHGKLSELGCDYL